MARGDLDVRDEAGNGITVTGTGGEELELTCVPCDPVVCLDLAAARAMGQCRGKSACVCNCDEVIFVFELSSFCT